MSEIVLFDLDSVEIVEAVERAFRIKISNEEAVACRTVGDLFAVVARQVATVDRGIIPCVTASCFRQIRAALSENSPRSRITPATQLTELMPVIGRRRWWRHLANSAGLVLPALPRRTASWHPSWIPISLAPPGIALMLGAGGWAALVWLTTVLAMFATSQFDAIRLGPGATVGDLAKATVSLNVGAFVAKHGALRQADAWAAFEPVIRNFTGYAGPIDKRTRFRCV